MALAALDITRTANGRFAPGRSGNPAGRPKEARNKATVLAEMLEEGEAEALVRALVERAHGGDQVALRFLVARLVPKAAPPPIQLALAPGAESDPDALVTATIRALADGEVTPQEAATIARVAVAAQRVKGRAEPPKRRQAGRAKDATPVSAEAATREPAGTADEAPLAAAGAAAPPPLFRLFSGAALAASGAGEAASGNCELAVGAASVAVAPPVSDLYLPAFRRLDAVAASA